MVPHCRIAAYMQSDMMLSFTLDRTAVRCSSGTPMAAWAGPGDGQFVIVVVGGRADLEGPVAVRR